MKISERDNSTGRPRGGLFCVRKRLRALILLGVFVAVALSLALSKYGLTVTHETIRLAKVQQSFRVTQLTDLHGQTFGEENARLIAAVEETEPDVILITGDLINYKKYTDETEACQLITALTEIAPVYLSLGNHEQTLIDSGIDIAGYYEAAGAVVLEQEYAEVDIAGQTVRIGGNEGYGLAEEYASGMDREAEAEFLKEFQDTEELTILMNHMPLCWVTGSSVAAWDVDVVFSGHVHGGQIRFPLIGGLWAPDQGFFPGKECGVYRFDRRESAADQDDTLSETVVGRQSAESESAEDETYVVLSRGLGNSDIVPRFNNIPEIMVVDFERR